MGFHLPWQLGEFVCYDLNKVFSMAGMKTDREVCGQQSGCACRFLPADAGIPGFLRFHKYKEEIMDGEQVNPDSVIIKQSEFLPVLRAGG